MPHGQHVLSVGTVFDRLPGLDRRPHHSLTILLLIVILARRMKPSTMALSYRYQTRVRRNTSHTSASTGVMMGSVNHTI